MRKNYFKSTKSETNLINSTGYIKWIRTKPLKNARFGNSTLGEGDLTKNVCSEYNDNANNFTGYCSVDVESEKVCVMEYDGIYNGVEYGYLELFEERFSLEDKIKCEDEVRQ